MTCKVNLSLTSYCPKLGIRASGYYYAYVGCYTSILYSSGMEENIIGLDEWPEVSVASNNRLPKR